MKLNNKRVLLVGLAFFIICVFWQAYDVIVPLMLVNKFGMSQTASGLIMSLDNLLALFMLPLFGALSDKTKTKYGKRKPFIVIGTLIAVISFVGLTIADNSQLGKLDVDHDVYWENNYTITNTEYDSFGNNDVAQEYTVQDYSAQIMFGKDYDQLTEAEKTTAKDYYLNIGYNSQFVYNRDTNTYSAIPDSDSDDYDADDYKDQGSIYKTYTSLVNSARSQYASTITQGQVAVIIIFIALLLITLIGMATFRSPAVALMPDVVVKPLRSKGNAIINLMGTAGGILVMGLGIVFGTSSTKNLIMSYTWYVIAVCAIMMLALIALIVFVKEKKWNAEMLDQQALLDQQQADNQPAQTETTETVEEKLSKPKLRSLILILASVALWFIGYNAITTKYSLYAVNVLNKDFNTTLLIAQIAAIIAYIPVGMLATKIGRRKSILIGVAMLTIAFGSATFVDSSSPDVLIYALFAMAGIAWATINVNSFPMVVELSRGGNIGKYTGFYYTASMSAQIITPILSGAIMDAMGNMSFLFPYGAIFVALSFATMFCVKHGDSQKIEPTSKLEMLGGADD